MAASKLGIIRGSLLSSKLVILVNERSGPIYARSILFPPSLVGPSPPLIDQRSGESRKLPSGRRRFLSISDTNLVIGALPAAGGSAPMSSDTRQHAV